jgi:hypothetical protein
MAPFSRARSSLLAALLSAGGADCNSSESGGRANGVAVALSSSDAASTCAMPGEATSGPPDTHCTLPDGGMLVQSTSSASCYLVSPADDGGGAACGYGPTMFGNEGDEDNCKFRVAWKNLTPICEGPAGVSLQVTVTRNTDGFPVTGANPGAEVFTTTPGDWDASDYCDTESTHIGPNSYEAPFLENPPGTYTGSIIFDRPGQWTVRFHFFGNCLNAPDSPHGHAAFHVTVP